MRMERINEHQVRCVITPQDLVAHKISSRDLKYGSKEMQELFRELLKDASEKYHFNEEGLPVMIEAIPIANNELLIIISAVEDADELDPHFARFRDTSIPIDGEESKSFRETEEVPETNEAVFFFEHFNEVIAFCKRLAGVRISTSLYPGSEPHTHYLVLHRPESLSNDDFIRLLYGLNEFASPVPDGATVYALLKEHGEPVMNNPHLILNAL